MAGETVTAALAEAVGAKLCDACAISWLWKWPNDNRI
jgi:hypothetical protein